MPSRSSSFSGSTLPCPDLTLKTAPLSVHKGRGKPGEGPPCGEAVHHVSGFDAAETLGHDKQPGVIIEAVEDLDVAVVGEMSEQSAFRRCSQLPKSRMSPGMQCSHGHPPSRFRSFGLGAPRSQTTRRRLTYGPEDE